MHCTRRPSCIKTQPSPLWLAFACMVTGFSHVIVAQHWFSCQDPFYVGKALLMLVLPLPGIFFFSAGIAGEPLILTRKVCMELGIWPCPTACGVLAYLVVLACWWLPPPLLCLAWYHLLWRRCPCIRIEPLTPWTVFWTCWTWPLVHVLSPSHPTHYLIMLSLHWQWQ